MDAPGRRVFREDVGDHWSGSRVGTTEAFEWEGAAKGRVAAP